jgi:dipeptidyl aminopeptidase/acylaminoacyl peptidase
MRIHPRSPFARPAAVALALLAGPAAAQTGRAPATSGGYLTPPAPISQILDAPPTPGVSVGRDGRTIALLERENLPAIAELAEPELRLAGFRISPRLNGPSAGRTSWITGITFQDLESGAQRRVSLPAGARVSSAQWSPDGSRMAFAVAADRGLELWVAERASGAARRVLPASLNATMGTPYEWLPDGSGFIVRQTVATRGPVPERPRAPTGPIVQENLGRTSPGRTYQDLLANQHDERLFDYYFTSQLARVPLAGGAPRPLGRPGIIQSASVSPNGEYVLVRHILPPYSYVAPASRFPSRVAVLDMTGREVKRVADIPATDNLPPAFDAAPTGPRDVEWRSDAPATLAWAEAQDGGDPRRPAPVRDRLFLLAAPFTAAPARWMDLDQRYSGVFWGRDDLALVVSREWNRRWERRYVASPGTPSAAPRMIADRTYDDRYGDPGFPVTTFNRSGHAVMMTTPDGRAVYMTGTGASPQGNYPFLDRMDVATARAERLWRAENPYFETVATVLDPRATRILTRRESLTDAPNFYVRTLPGGTARPVTRFADPAPQLAGVQRQLITYKRADGVTLSGTLYLPPNYDAARDGRLPLLMWAYPTEFVDAASAGQVNDSPNRFSRPGGTSHLFLLTQGYAVLDNPTMPIVGGAGKEANDSYIEQLVASAQAAVDKVVEMGVADRERIAVGGHSYGAFMTANLLAHSDLFRAGIARSGAYNRTLTPFGFQAEQRTYWDATDTYTRMSPFTYANRVNEPILMIHGEADDNSGTFPIQSERFYAALKGHGATVRYVVLPFEAHGYRARESTKHTLAEMVNWLDQYVKKAGPRPAAPATPPATR